MLLRISKATFLLFGTGFNYLHDAPHGKDSSSGDTVAFMPITIATGFPFKTPFRKKVRIG